MDKATRWSHGLHFKQSLVSIVDVSSLCTRRVECFDHLAVVELTDVASWREAVRACYPTILLDTGYREWIWLKKCQEYSIHVSGDDEPITAWVGHLLTTEEVVKKAALVTTDDFVATCNARESMPIAKSIYARCKDSMMILDNLYRRLFERLDLRRYPLVSVRAVAGGGKTTALMKLAQAHPDKRFLYVAFSKSLVQSLRERKQSNVDARTFDSLVYDVVSDKTAKIVDPRPQSLQFHIPWFQKKSRKLKRQYIRMFQDFCMDPVASDIARWMPGKPLLKVLWDTFSRTTFDGLRKLAQLTHAFRNKLDERYDVIMVDEAQDFDAIMFDILMKDTTVPKIYVGDPLQSIFKWRGSINVFDRLPNDAFMIEFYSSFRVGSTACTYVSGQVPGCWMVSRSPWDTQVWIRKTPSERYVYLFRTWKGLLTRAGELNDVWINDFDPLSRKISKMMETIDSDVVEEEEEDDLPGFIRNMKKDGMESLMTRIQSNLVKEGDAHIKCYTIFGFKGLEHPNVRIHDDYDPRKEPELHYVALTRGMHNTFID